VFVTNHVLSGVIIGRTLERRPVAAFLVGVGSHLVLDSVPHWSCDKTLADAPERFLEAAKKDGVLGLATMATITMVVDRRSRMATVAAMAGAVLLDLDKPFVHFAGINPFPKTVQRLHSWVQNESPQWMRNELIFGIASATADAIAIAGGRARGSLSNREPSTGPVGDSPKAAYTSS
jgi:hypothetical protein